MQSVDYEILERALQRERKARKQAEKLLEEKANELYQTARHLRETNEKLQVLMDEQGPDSLGDFMSIIDPYVVMDLNSRVLKMNTSAKEFLGYDQTEEEVILSDLVHPDYVEYTRESFQNLMKVGIIKNYNPIIRTRTQGERSVNINASVILDREGNPIAAQGVLRDVTQEREIKRLLDQQRREQDIIVENSPLGILLLDQEQIIKANRSFIKLTGYDINDIRGHSLDDFSESEEIMWYEKELKPDTAPLKAHNRVTEVRRFTRKNGGYFLGKTSISEVRDASGALLYKVAVIEDITSDLLADKKLRASEERMVSLIRNLQTGILVEDENQQITLANDKYCELLGLEILPESLHGLSGETLRLQQREIYRDDDIVENRLRYILQKKELVLSDELILKDGRTLERDYIPIYSGDTYKGHLWSYNDVTLRNNYRRNLEVQKAKYSSIIAHMNLGLIEVSLSDTVIMVNQSFCQMSGFSSQELVGRKLDEFLQFDLKNSEPSDYQSQFITDDGFQSSEIRVCRKDGEKRTWFISGAPNYGETGKYSGYILVTLDITELKELQTQKEKLLKELEDSNRGLEEYAHIVSHDLKSPLRSVSALSTWLHDDYKDQLDENGQYNLKMMQEKIEGMDRLIDGILKYSTVNSSTLDQTEFNVTEVIREISEIIYIPDHVRVRIVSNLPVLRADRTKIYQVFQNLIGNAVVNIEKPQGFVDIGFEDQATHWQFSVADNGVGIPSEYHEKIFEIFQSIGSRDRSTGIGLSIIKKIVDRYQGKIWLESEVGIGTTFYFTLKKELQ